MKLIMNIKCIDTPDTVLKMENCEKHTMIYRCYPLMEQKIRNYRRNSEKNKKCNENSASQRVEKIRFDSRQESIVLSESKKYMTYS